MKKEFTKQEKLLIINCYKKELKSIATIVKEFNSSRKTISEIIKNANIEIVNRQNLLNYDLLKDILPLYNSGISLTKLAIKFNTTRNTLARNFKKNGINVINRQNRCKFNKTIFDSIDTEEKAYWLGFIYADGYISSKDYSFELSLSIIDIDHLHKFNKFMEHEKNNIKISSVILKEKTFNRCRWFIANKHLWNTLNNYGCTPRKSLTVEFPNENIFKSKDLIRHFIRGYFDGDGCISYVNKSHTKLHCSFMGTKHFLNNINYYIYNNPKSLTYSNKKNNLTTMTLAYSWGTAIKILNILYNDTNIYLNRKFKKFIDFNNNCRSVKELAE